ncbi:hypothetical protein C8Q75DRAFT_811887 [Abortiporus biennis]|nr:hypothetical protein C8Q75DRAFT_811887 [Abortiporus biennis]
MSYDPTGGSTNHGRNNNSAYPIYDSSKLPVTDRDRSRGHQPSEFRPYRSVTPPANPSQIRYHKEIQDTLRVPDSYAEAMKFDAMNSLARSP